jgi:hypothetical protein
VSPDQRYKFRHVVRPGKATDCTVKRGLSMSMLVSHLQRSRIGIR